MTSDIDFNSIYSKYINYEIPFPHPGSWALDIEACKFLGSFMRHCKFNYILEFGSGFSTSLMAYELEKHNLGMIDSVDDSFYWSSQASYFASKYNLAHRIRFHVFKLKLKRRKFYGHVFYNMNFDYFCKDSAYDLILIDAPHHDLGRDGAIYQTLDILRIGGFFFVHDSNSNHMKATLDRWHKCYSSSISIISFNDIGYGVTLIRKVQNSEDGPVFSLHQFITGWMRTIRNYRRLKYITY